MDIYNDFTAMFNERIEGEWKHDTCPAALVDRSPHSIGFVYSHCSASFLAFITSNGSTLEEFVKKCDAAEEESFALQLILSVTSFDAFKVTQLHSQSQSMRSRRGNRELTSSVIMCYVCVCVCSN